MKGIVVDLNNKYAVVLSKKGEFIRVKNNGKFTIGQEIVVDSKIVNYNFKALSKTLSIAAAFLLMLGISIGVYVYNMPYNYINIDINPSMEFTVNIFNMVLDAKGLNDDGKELLKKYSYKHLKIDKVIGEFIKAAVDEGFLGETNDNAVLITVSGKNYDKLSNVQKEMVNTVNTTLEQDKIQSEVVTEKVTLTERDSAKELGISPGKLVLIEKLKQKKPDIEVNEYKEKPVKDILASIKQEKKDIPKKPGEHNITVPENNKKINEPKNLTHEDIKLKDREQKVIESKDRVENGPKSNEIGHKDKTPLETKLKDKGQEDSEQKNIPPKNPQAEGEKLKHNELKVNGPGDSDTKNSGPKDSKPKDNPPKVNGPKDDKPKGNKPEDNKVGNIHQQDGAPKDKISKSTDIKSVDIKEPNNKDKGKDNAYSEKDENKP